MYTAIGTNLSATASRLVWLTKELSLCLERLDLKYQVLGILLFEFTACDLPIKSKCNDAKTDGHVGQECFTVLEIKQYLPFEITKVLQHYCTV